MAIDEPAYALDWLISTYEKRLDLNSATGKKEFSDVIMTVVRGLADKVEQDHYVQRLADILHVSREALLTKLQPAQPARLKRRLKASDPLDKTVIEMGKTQDHFLALVLLQTKLRDFLE